MKRAKQARTSVIQQLEQRCLFAAVSMSSGVMNITGTSGQLNQLAVTSDSQGRLWGIADNVRSFYSTNQVTSIAIHEGSAGDRWSVGSGVMLPVNVLDAAGKVVASRNIVADPPAVDPSTIDPSAPVAAIMLDNSATILPGQAVFVNGLTSVLNGGTCLTAKYQWDFGDAGSPYDQLVGFNAAHAYSQPGSYTITLTVTNSLGKVSTATQAVQVLVDNRPTIYIDAVNGSDANSGASPSSAIKTFAHLTSIIQPDEIVLFARGQIFPVTSAINVSSNQTFDAYGTGSAPELRWQAPLTSGICFFRCSASARNVVVQNLTMDVLNPTDTNMPDGVAAAGMGIVVRDNTFLNIGDCVNANGSPDGLLVQGNSAPLDTGMIGYMVWFQGTDGVIVGNNCANSTRQHCIRASYNFSRLLIEDNSLQNLDRRTLGDSLDYSKSCLDMQWGSYIYINGNHLTDGSMQLGPLGADELANYPDTAKAERETWLVAENNTITNSDVHVDPGSQDMVIRRNIVMLDNLPAFYIGGWDSKMQRMVVNVSFLNNTAVNNGAQGNCFYISGQTSGVVLDNNLYIAPNIQIGSYSSTAAVYVYYSNLSGFRDIANNVWPEPPANQRTHWANGGVNYMFAGNSSSGFYNEINWDKLPGVTNDLFENINWNNGKPTPPTSAGAQ